MCAVGCGMFAGETSPRDTCVLGEWMAQGRAITARLTTYIDDTYLVSHPSHPVHGTYTTHPTRNQTHPTNPLAVSTTSCCGA